MEQQLPSLNSRVKFPIGQQRIFLDKVRFDLGWRDVKLAEYLSISTRTIRDWRREKYLMTLGMVQKLVRLIGENIPTDVTILDAYWYANKGSKKSWATIKAKYGRIPVDENYRQQKWREWWESKGRFLPNSITSTSKTIVRPKFSKDLAEFVGVMLGDGGMTPLQLTISTNSVTDREYALFVKNLIQKLFHLS